MKGIAHSIIGCILIYMTLAQYKELDCSDMKTSHNVVECRSSEEHAFKFFVLPMPLFRYLDCTYMQILISEGTILFNRIDFFQEYPMLEILLIEQNEQSAEANPISTELQNQMDKLRATLFNLPHLRQLSIKYLNFNSKTHTWNLPNRLEHLTIQNCQYTEYDLRNLHYLESLDFTGNQFTKLPLLHYPLYTLRELRLGSNPLSDVTTNDIAKLCALEKLNLDRTSFQEADRYCECVRLRMWIGNLTDWMATEHYKIFNAEAIPKCNNEKNIICKPEEISLEEAITQRDQCVYAKKVSIESSLLTIVFTIMLLLIVLVVIYTIYHLACKGYFKKHFASNKEKKITSTTNKPHSETTTLK